MAEGKPRTLKEEGAYLAQRMQDLVNAFDNDGTIGFVEQMNKAHPTLQQSFTRLCVVWLKYLAEKYDKNWYDKRNEASCKLGKWITEEGEKNYKTYLPFI